MMIQILQHLVQITSRLQQLLYNLRQAHNDQLLRVVCLSDTHSQRVAIPSGDLLVHSGDLTRSGQPSEIQETISWLNSHSHMHKVVIAGNADLALDPKIDRTADDFDWGNVIYLNGSNVCLEFSLKDGATRKLRIYGDPHVPRCGPDGQEAFQYELDEDYWRDAIPSDSDVVITHTPPKFILDEWDGSPEGCPSLLAEVGRVRPKLHVFGHVHPGYGRAVVMWDRLAFQGFMLRKRLHELNSSRVLPWASVTRFTLHVFVALPATIWNMLLGSRHRQGGESTLFVNAACASPDGKYMKNLPAVVDI